MTRHRTCMMKGWLKAKDALQNKTPQNLNIANFWKYLTYEICKYLKLDYKTKKMKYRHANMIIAKFLHTFLLVNFDYLQAKTLFSKILKLNLYSPTFSNWQKILLYFFFYIHLFVNTKYIFYNHHQLCTH